MTQWIHGTPQREREYNKTQKIFLSREPAEIIPTERLLLQFSFSLCYVKKENFFLVLLLLTQHIVLLNCKEKSNLFDP